MFVPKPKVTIKPIQKQDYFLPSGEPVPYDKSIWTHGRNFYVQFRNATHDQIRGHIKYRNGKFLIRRRIYIQFELRESVRTDGQSKSKSRALKSVTIRQGERDVPKEFFKSVKNKLEGFGLTRSEQNAVIDQVRTHLERVIEEHSG
jgi:hypothetical protein